jgi:hypothetical protein
MLPARALNHEEQGALPMEHIAIPLIKPLDLLIDREE